MAHTRQPAYHKPHQELFFHLRVCPLFRYRLCDYYGFSSSTTGVVEFESSNFRASRSLSPSKILLNDCRVLAARTPTWACLIERIWRNSLIRGTSPLGFFVICQTVITASR